MLAHDGEDEHVEARGIELHAEGLQRALERGQQFDDGRALAEDRLLRLVVSALQQVDCRAQESVQQRREPFYRIAQRFA
eukprot:750336-Hanusia_phi.AAC.3